MHAGDAHAVAGDADEADEALVAGLGQRLDRAAGAVGDLPLVGLDEVVQLDQVDRGRPAAARASAPARPGPRRRCARRSWWRGRTSSRCSAIHGADAQLGVAVAGRGVDVVHAVARAAASSTSSARSWRIEPSAAAPKIDAGALVAGAAERRLCDHPADCTHAAIAVLGALGAKDWAGGPTRNLRPGSTTSAG